MTIKKHPAHGAYVVSDIVEGYLVSRIYIGYTKKEALALFKKNVKGDL